MNEQQAKLIEQLAVKLGTTTEYLWGIMCRQAQIDAIISIILVGVAILGSIALVIVVRKIFKDVEQDKKWVVTNGFDYVVPIVFWVCAGWLVFDVITIFSISNIVTALSNPEYWALEKIMEMIK
jgi:hypothetical protein